MSIHITDRSLIPRDEFNFTDQNKGRVFRAKMFGRLVLRVQEYQRANGFRVWTESELEADYCKRYAHNCYDDSIPRKRATEHTDMLTRVASAVGIPAADVLHKLSAKLGVHCKTCDKRHGIIRRMRELGFEEALRQLKETL